MTTMTDSRAAGVLDRLALGAEEPDVHAALAHAIARLRESAEAQRCTCPSGDGSLRWPCPAHPPEAQAQGGGFDPVAWHVVDEYGDLIANYMDEASAREVASRWENRGSRIRPLIYGDTVPPSAPVGVEAIAAEIRASLGKGATVVQRRQWAGRLEALAQQPAPVAPVGVEGDLGIDADDSADYIEHCAARLDLYGQRVTAAALRAIAEEHRALAQQREGAVRDHLIRMGWTPPAEAQAQGGEEYPMTEAEVRQWIDACNHEPARQVLRDYLRLRTAPPSAPVGVERLVEKWRKESESIDIHPAGLAARRICAIELEHALAQQPAAAPVGVEDKARVMFEAQADNLAAPWDRQWEPTKGFWRKRAAEAIAAQQPAAVDGDWCFDDMHIGKSSNGNRSLTKRIIPRPPHLSNAEWYAHGRAVIEAITAQPGGA